MPDATYLSPWEQNWLESGDDIHCPNCGEQQIETQDNYSLCNACGWASTNNASKLNDDEEEYD